MPSPLDFPPHFSQCKGCGFCKEKYGCRCHDFGYNRADRFNTKKAAEGRKGRNSSCSCRKHIMKQIENPYMRTFAEYAIITASMMLMAAGTYFFKFPNNFSFGGVAGFSTVVSALTSLSASDFTSIANIVLLFFGFAFLGRDFGFKTVYATLVMSAGLWIFERFCPLTHTITDQPLLELLFAVFLPGIGSAVLFNIGASSGGTDIIAMILKKHTSLNIGTVLMLVDVAAVVSSFFVFGPETGLFSLVGLAAKSLVIDNVIESINLCKCFNIICDDAEPICSYIIHTLGRSATVYKAQGAFSHHQKTIILTTMHRGQAVKLRNFIRRTEPTAFILISNSSEIIGKGFLSH